MDTLAFLITLGVAIAVIVWYVLNEAKNADGALGLFAIRDAGERAKDAGETVRYRIRERLTPAGRGLRAPGAQRAYRAKAAKKPSWRDGDGENKGD